MTQLNLEGPRLKCIYIIYPIPTGFDYPLGPGCMACDNWSGKKSKLIALHKLAHIMRTTDYSSMALEYRSY